MKDRTISIIGCGWLGLPLGKDLIEIGYRVHGSTTSESKLPMLKDEGIMPFLIDLRKQVHLPNLVNFLQSDILFVNVPPRRKELDPTGYSQQMELLINHAEKAQIRKVILISSTSVYASNNTEVTEQTQAIPETASGNVLKATEELFCNNANFQTTVLRMAGLVGPDRHPGRFLSGKKNLENPGGRVNLIHLDDCIGIICNILKNQVWGETFNCCSGVHPTRHEFYSTAATKLNIAVPEFKKNADTKFKLVSNAKVKQQLGYEFKYSDPLLMI